MTLPRHWYLYALGALLIGVVLALWVRARQRAAAEAAKAVYVRNKFKSELPDNSLMAWKAGTPTTTPPEDRSHLTTDPTLYEMLK